MLWRSQLFLSLLTFSSCRLQMLLIHPISTRDRVKATAAWCFTAESLGFTDIIRHVYMNDNNFTNDWRCTLRLCTYIWVSFRIWPDCCISVLWITIITAIHASGPLKLSVSVLLVSKMSFIQSSLEARACVAKRFVIHVETFITTT